MGAFFHSRIISQFKPMKSELYLMYEMRKTIFSYILVTYFYGKPIGVISVGVLNYSVLILTPLLKSLLAINAKTTIIIQGTKKAFHNSTEPIPKNPILNASIM